MKTDRSESHHWVTDGDGNRHWVLKGTDPSSLPRTIYPYSEITTEVVCRLLRKGETFISIGRIDGMPPTETLYWWRQRYPDFCALTDEAVKQRGHLMNEFLLEQIKDIDESNVQSQKLIADLRKHLAAVGDPDRFGARVKHSGDSTQPITFLIDTGIRDTKVIEAEPAQVALPATPSIGGEEEQT